MKRGIIWGFKAWSKAQASFWLLCYQHQAGGAGEAQGAAGGAPMAQPAAGSWGAQGPLPAPNWCVPLTSA